MLAEKLIIWKSKLYDLQIDVSRTQIWIFMEYNGISFFFICNKDTHEILRLWILVYRAGFWDMIDWSEKKSDHQKVFFGISTFTWYPVFPPTPSFYICFDFSKRHAKFDDFTGETTKRFNRSISSKEILTKIPKHFKIQILKIIFLHDEKTFLSQFFSYDLEYISRVQENTLEHPRECTGRGRSRNWKMRFFFVLNVSLDTLNFMDPLYIRDEIDNRKPVRGFRWTLSTTSPINTIGFWNSGLISE